MSFHHSSLSLLSECIRTKLAVRKACEKTGANRSPKPLLGLGHEGS